MAWSSRDGAEINPVRIEMPENGLDDFDYVAPQSAPEAPASAISAEDDAAQPEIPDAPTDAPDAAPDWPSLYDMFDEASIEPRKWIYAHHYLRSFEAAVRRGDVPGWRR